ncbi:uncharacterized protein AMSG_05842 [Thecamonas trahens ATCC 50062]|uniref:HMG box domain-containing protein n=1 Tax=Thecamonas trahens ATCC 50062 TaxID=461836 RepID=A0A0L0DFJ9_THETB|nr:hypothetical protein AMSG_05842 [Thecamonas trahens ATCC 50062]KNC50078.1 hypothetical protein AMSG_05842 [Thecamonas trahens ATCC 50062]|eukprot:XP_013757242.1 hypothetical protein AMSG_05842 [Thecamonas trahens ATCC 50062]
MHIPHESPKVARMPEPPSPKRRREEGDAEAAEAAAGRPTKAARRRLSASPSPPPLFADAPAAGGEDGTETGGADKDAAAPPVAPKRPLSAYMLFSASKRAEVAASMPPGSRATDVMRALGAAWKALSTEEQAAFKAQAAAAKAEYKPIHNNSIAMLLLGSPYSFQASSRKNSSKSKSKGAAAAAARKKSSRTKRSAPVASANPRQPAPADTTTISQALAQASEALAGSDGKNDAAGESGSESDDDDTTQPGAAPSTMSLLSMFAAPQY